MIISDLNYLEATEGSAVVGGASRQKGGFKNNIDIKKKVDIDIDVKLDINKYVDSDVDVKGQLADAEAYADVYGKDGLAETYTGTVVKSGYTGAYSSSVSAK